jgi:Transposase DDE domain group 1
MQNCTESATPLQLTFDISGVKKIDAAFDGGNLSSDGGLVLLKLADEKVGLSKAVARYSEKSGRGAKSSFRWHYCCNRCGT